MGASSSVISSSILLPCFIIGAQLLHPFAANNEIIYKVFMGVTIIGMALLSWGLTRDLVIGDDRNRFGLTLVGWFAVLFVIIVLNGKAQTFTNIDDLLQFQC